MQNKRDNATLCMAPGIIMDYAATIYQRSLQLPEQAAREALDFIDFLALRYSVAGPQSMQRDTDSFLRAISSGWEGDFPDDISGDDLGADAPRAAL